MAGGSYTSEQLLSAGLWALPGLGAVSLREILAALGDRAASALELPFEEWLLEAPVQAQAGNLLEKANEAGLKSAAEAAERVFERCQKTGIRLAFRGEPAYPARLGEVRDAPPLLFYLGPGAISAARARVALVGTRKPDDAGIKAADRLSTGVARGGMVVVSGAAAGIDTCCHEGALAVGGETWAVLGSSLDQIDGGPRPLVWRILEKGGSVFSELPPGVRADRKKFPQRNRLICGSSDLTVVVRAPLKAEGRSGALHTADDAREQGRPLMAVPGDVEIAAAAGSNQYLQNGWARLCLDVGDILKELGLPPDVVPPAPPRQVFVLPDTIGAEARRVFEALGGRPMDFDALMVASGLDSGQVAAALTELELADAVLERPGRVYYRAQ